MTAKYGVMNLTIDRIRTGTRPAVSLHRRSMTEGMIRMTETCATSSTVEMHVAGLTTSARSLSASSKSDMMIGTMTIMVPSMTNLTNNTPLKEGATQEESRPFTTI
jgi:microcystin degradation protein MlrC